MALADIAGGINKTVQQILLERELQRLGVTPAQVLARQQGRADEELGLRRQEMATRQQELALGHERQARLDASAEQQRVAGEATRLGDQIPEGRFLASSDPAVSMMQQGGLSSLMSPAVKERPAMGEDFAGPMDTGETPQEAQTGKQKGFLKTMSQKQRDTETDNARQQAQLESAAADRAAGREERQQNAQIAHQDRQASQASLDAYRQAMLQRQPQGRESFDEWKRKEDYKAQLGAEKPTKLPQREDDTVVSIHQMTPLIDELLTKTKARVAASGQKGLLGSLGEKAGRLVTKAEYSAGLPVAPADAERIQLASLLQILGTVPYLRGIRNMQFVNQIQQHLADPSATDASLLDRLQTLKRILPEMEQAIYDVHNQGKIPHSHGNMGAGAVAPAAGGSSFKVVGER